MVHALDEIHRLLKPGGCLIDIHPFAEAPLYKVSRGKKVLFSQPKPVFCPDDYHSADHALRQAVADHKYILERSGEFEYIIQASSTVELSTYFEMIDAYNQSTQDEAEAAREAAFLATVDKVRLEAGEGAEVATHERVHISRFKPIK